MTKHDDRKRRVRARMAKTGESYTTARARLGEANEHAGSDATKAKVVVDSRAGMSDALSLAFTEAKRLAVEGGAEQVAPAHLCAGLALAPGSIAQQALVEAGVTADDCERRIVFDVSAARATTDVGLSVTARTALEYAREALAAAWQSQLAVLAAESGLVQAERSGRLVWEPRPPLRTGHVLLGLLEEGSIVSLLPRVGAPTLRDRARELLETDRELAPRWSSQSRYQNLPRHVRGLVTDLDEAEVREPTSVGHGLYRDIATLLDSLPAHRQAQPPIAVWHVATRRVKQRLDALPTSELEALTPSALEAMLATVLDADPTVIRARRWADRQRG